LKPFLLDVNVIVALFWRHHIHHRAAHLWLAKKRHAGVRTCPITQAGFLRIVTNARYSSDRLPMAEARATLRELVDMEEHMFWADDLHLEEALEGAGPISGHQQITDAYLLGLAIGNGGLLATFDRGVLGLRGAKGFVELIAA
jgi:toxin-antitoxin system PIN domain toxin